MSREDLANFIHASEHSSSLRSELKKCTKISDIFELARIYGFIITAKDLEREENLAKMDHWFSISKISTFQK